MVKSLKFIVKTDVFEGFEGCVRERKKVSKTSTPIPKSIPKSMRNQVIQKHRNSFNMEFQSAPTTMKEPSRNEAEIGC